MWRWIKSLCVLDCWLDFKTLGKCFSSFLDLTVNRSIRKIIPTMKILWNRLAKQKKKSHILDSQQGCFTINCKTADLNNGSKKLWLNKLNRKLHFVSQTCDSSHLVSSKTKVIFIGRVKLSEIHSWGKSSPGTRNRLIMTLLAEFN